MAFEQRAARLGFSNKFGYCFYPACLLRGEARYIGREDNVKILEQIRPAQPSKENNPANTLISDIVFTTVRKLLLCCLNLPVCAS